MRAVVLHTFGDAGRLRWETAPDPVPGPGEVRIAVEAAGVHFIETVMRAGKASDLAPPLPDLPVILGGEVSGTVDALGPGVDREWLGRRVVTAHGRPGGYAELAVAGTSALHPVPDGMGFETAAAMVVTGATAVGLLRLAALTADDVVLVTSAAGGIGRLAVQHARDLGATVVGAAGGPAKTEAVRELGADVAVDYRTPGWEKTVLELLGERRVSVVLDGVAGDLGRAAFDTLAPGGRYVTIGASSQEEFEPTPELLAERRVTRTDALTDMLTHREREPELQREALAAAAAGRLTPTVTTFPLSRAADAHAALEDRRTAGKVVLVREE